MNELAFRSQLNNLEALRSSLHSSLRFWEWMVVVGLVIDLVVIVKEYWDELADFRRGKMHPPERPGTLLLLLGLLGTGLIAVGIARELAIDSRIEGVETETRQVNGQLFGIVSHEAQEAAEASSSAKIDAKGAKEISDTAKASASSALALVHKTRQYLAQLATPRDIVVSDRDGDHEERATRFAEVKKYPGTVAVIQWIPEYEPRTYALHLAAALIGSGWKVEPMTPEQSHIPYEFMSEGVRVITLEESLLEPGDPSSAEPKHPFPAKSKAFAPATALVRLLDLDLGPPYGPEYFGVHWEPEYNDPRFASFTKRGFVFPEGAILILVGAKPAEYAAHIHKKQKKNAKP